MISQILPSIRAIVVFTILTGVLYPLGITAVSQVALSRKANGSLVSKDGKLVGSELLAQKFESPKYFHPRPSAADFGTVASGASNQGFTSAKASRCGERTPRRDRQGCAVGSALCVRQRTRSAHFARGRQLSGRWSRAGSRNFPRCRECARREVHRSVRSLVSLASRA